MKIMVINTNNGYYSNQRSWSWLIMVNDHDQHQFIEVDFPWLLPLQICSCLPVNQSHTYSEWWVTHRHFRHLQPEILHLWDARTSAMYGFRARKSTIVGWISQSSFLFPEKIKGFPNSATEIITLNEPSIGGTGNFHDDFRTKTIKINLKPWFTQRFTNNFCQPLSNHLPTSDQPLSNH